MNEEIYKTEGAAIIQGETESSFLLTYKSEVIEFTLCDLYSFKNKIMNLDLMEYFESSSPDLELIHLPHCDRILLLNIHEILQFRTLLNATFDILALNSSIQKILRKNIFNF